MKNQVLFSSKNKSKKFKCRLLQFLFGALRVKIVYSETEVFLTIVFVNIWSEIHELTVKIQIRLV